MSPQSEVGEAGLLRSISAFAVSIASRITTLFIAEKSVSALPSLAAINLIAPNEPFAGPVCIGNDDATAIFLFTMNACVLLMR